ncbi:MAG: hypothetical protein RLZZ308_663 [Candidatus Parcubacteria bacterium]|jgi:hypothetical protein
MKLFLSTLRRYIEKLPAPFKRLLKKIGVYEELVVDEVSMLMDDETLLIRQKIEGRKKKQKKLKRIFWGLVSLVVILGIWGMYSQYKLQKLSEEEQIFSLSPDKQPKTGEEVVKALSRHIIVPQGMPQIALVQDASRLRETQAFFKDVENGDIVVVYDTAIYLYRPSQDIVVNAGDISGIGQVNP